jgi:hypothetical protein
MATKDTALSDVDVIVMHAPGTIKGFNRYKVKSLWRNLPLLTSTNKWKIHTFGCIRILSMGCHFNDAEQYVCWSSF